MSKDVAVKCSAHAAETDKMAQQKQRLAEIRERRSQKMAADGVTEEDMRAQADALNNADGEIHV